MKKIRCYIEPHYGAYIVSFAKKYNVKEKDNDGKTVISRPTILLRAESDIESFCENCGKTIEEIEDICYCSEEYLDVAELD